MSNENFFRKSSMERISSPEQLNNYIKVATPSVWMVLATVIVLLAGVCIWGVFGHLDTKIKATAVAENGEVTCYVSAQDAKDVEPGMTVAVGDDTGVVLAVDEKLTEVGENFDSYALYLGELKVGDWVCAITVDAPVSDGVYESQITVDSVTPMSFILN